jgi:guanylate kinase
VSPARRGLPCRTFPVVLSAPSGAGKTTIARRLRERRGDVVFSVSATTRAPRRHERNGVDYHFVPVDEFRRMIDAGELAEWAEVHGNYYGTPLANLTRAVERSQFLLLDIDVQGARQIRKVAADAVHVFILPPNGDVLAERLLRRGSEGEEVRQRRLSNACGEVQSAAEFDYVVVNDDLDATVDAVEKILATESHRVQHLPEMGATLERICREIGKHVAPPPGGAREIAQTQERSQ